MKGDVPAGGVCAVRCVTNDSSVRLILVSKRAGKLIGVLHSAASQGHFFVFNHLKFNNRGEFQFKVVFKRPEYLLESVHRKK